MRVLVDVGMALASRTQEQLLSDGALLQFVNQNFSSLFPDLKIISLGLGVGIPTRHIDILVYDEKQNCFAIILCKSEINEYVIEQISKDYDAMMNNKGTVAKTHTKRGISEDYTSYNWDKAYAILVSQNFSSFETSMCSKITCGLQIFKLLQYAGGIILIDSVFESNRQIKQSVNTIKDYLDTKTGSNTRRLCQNIIRHLRKDPGLRVTTTSTHLQFKTRGGVIICSLTATKTFVKLTYNIQAPDPSFEGHNFIQNIYTTLHRKLGDYETKVTSMYMFKKTIPFIKTILESKSSKEPPKSSKLEDWVALSTNIDMNKKPTIMMCPDGSTVAVKSWTDLVFRMVVWLHKNNNLGLRHCPIKGGQRYILSGTAIHPNGKAFAKPRQTGPLYMETDYDSKRVVQYAANITKCVKKNLSNFWVRS
ncbi:MAG: hypothetical protein F4Z46_03105 [Cenarchaeum sp. SB0667_bin_13]|nr:hypothetical protein [Cenarchaeum sp. SB0667_bin_13]MYG33706.1 hypothetical protein [Cenarchaeum sp. SB0677_bin_16]